MRYTDRFRAMDTDIDVEVVSPGFPTGLGAVRALIAEQEQRFSRFIPTSLTCRLNAGETIVDPTFVAGCRLALDAWRITDGLFNPLILTALEAAGYDRSFSAVRTGGALHPGPVASLDQALLVDGETVRLRGGAIDLGGIVKGWTVDLALARLRASADAALVNAGGDLGCFGQEDGQPGWQVAVAAPDGGVAWRGVLLGSLATSTTLRRRWTTAAGGVAHHLIDPRTGVPSESRFVQVSVRGAETWHAEVWAKAVLIGGDDVAERARSGGVSLLALKRDGGKETWGEWS